MKSYMEYLAEIELDDIELNDLTVEKLINLETKKGYSIVGEDSVSVSLMRKFEPMSILNTVTIFEKMNEFIVVDPFGLTMYEGPVEEVVEFVEGFYSEEDLEAM